MVSEHSYSSRCRPLSIRVCQRLPKVMIVMLSRHGAPQRVTMPLAHLVQTTAGTRRSAGIREMSSRVGGHFMLPGPLRRTYKTRELSLGYGAHVKYDDFKPIRMGRRRANKDGAEEDFGSDARTSGDGFESI